MPWAEAHRRVSSPDTQLHPHHAGPYWGAAGRGGGLEPGDQLPRLFPIWLGLMCSQLFAIASSSAIRLFVSTVEILEETIDGVSPRILALVLVDLFFEMGMMKKSQKRPP